MGIFQSIFGKRGETAAGKAKETFQLLEGYRPHFTSWQGSIFESDLIRAALDAHGRHAAKLTPVFSGSAKAGLVNALRIQPNTWQTWPQFLYRMAVTLYAQNTAFVVPVRGTYGETTGIICVAPVSWETVKNSDGQVYVRMTFADNHRAAVELRDLGILTRYQYRSELFGETNSAMKSTLDLIEMQRQGIQEGIRNGATFRFSAVASNMWKDEDLAKERLRFDARNFQGKSGGLLIFPSTLKDIQQIKQDAYKVDADQQAAIKQNVFDYFGVNEDILQNKAFGDAWLAFYEGAIEWLAIQTSESISRMLYTEQERRRGNRLTFTSNRLQYMSNSDKLSAISQLADRGLMTRNELREILNLAPLPEPYGSQIPARGEYYDVTDPPKDHRPDDAPPDPDDPFAKPLPEGGDPE